MRNKLAFILLAVTTAFPVAAQNWTPRDGGSNGASETRQHRRDNGERQRQARPDRGGERGREGQPNAIRPTPIAPSRDAGRDQRPTGTFPGREIRPNQYQGRDGARRNEGANRDYRGRDERRDQRPTGTFSGRDFRQGDYNARGQAYRRDNDDRSRWNQNDRGRWNNGWRNDRRYDWRGYRSSNRDRFRLPRYYAPRGYQYRRWSPGYRLEPFFYGRSYWIMDPWEYRLPPAYGPYRWVRYYDDVLLVDIDTGMVVDVITDFFWN